MLHQIKEQMSAIEQILDSLPLQSGSPEVSELHTSLNQIMMQTTVLDSQTQSNEQYREAIAKIRLQIHHMTSKLEELQTIVAVQYRNILGDGKESFEQLSADEQLTVNAAAFESRGTFHALVKMGDVLSLIGSYLMDRSGNLESLSQASKKAPEIGDVELYDKDPTPPSLSP